MLEFFFANAVLWTILTIVGLAVGYAFTHWSPKGRRWLSRDPERASYIGLGVLVLAWISVAIFNRVSGGP